VALIVVGVGAAVLTAASLAIVTERFRGSRRSLAVAVWAGTGTIVGGLGPSTGRRDEPGPGRGRRIVA
jgi:hypothetical protein